LSRQRQSCLSINELDRIDWTAVYHRCGPPSSHLSRPNRRKKTTIQKRNAPGPVRVLGLTENNALTLQLKVAPSSCSLQRMPKKGQTDMLTLLSWPVRACAGGHHIKTWVQFRRNICVQTCVNIASIGFGAQ
jgi:hypothetical protein